MPYPKILLYVLITLSGCGHADSSTRADEAAVSVHFHASFNPSNNRAEVTLSVTQQNGALRNLRFRAPAERYTLTAGENARQNDDHIEWQPPKNGGHIRYNLVVDHAKGSGMDAQMTTRWVLIRLRDLFPSAAVRTVKGSAAKSSFSLDGPAGWRFETPYGDSSAKVLSIDGARKVPSPRGWLVGGEIGVRRAVISGRNVAIAAPRDSEFRRLDVLTFLNWTLPELSRTAPSLPQRILIVGAPASMWRGGLSAPRSLYLHVGRPLVSENATSTLLHELMHIAGLHSAKEGGDWLVEGLAELYSLLILRRSEGISEARFQRTLEGLQAWATRDGGRLTDPSTGADTAAAVVYLAAVADALRKQGSNIDGLLRQLLEATQITPQRWYHILSEALGASHPLVEQVRPARHTATGT